MTSRGFLGGGCGRGGALASQARLELTRVLVCSCSGQSLCASVAVRTDARLVRSMLDLPSRVLWPAQSLVGRPKIGKRCAHPRAGAGGCAECLERMHGVRRLCWRAPFLICPVRTLSYDIN